jgi:uncharacterized protein (DUF2336 family)
MTTIAREIDQALKAVSLVRRFLRAGAPEAGALDLALWKLLKRGSPILRAEMAEQLAHLPNGPRLTLRALACDADPEVALPILRHSSALSDAALAERARCKGEDHLAAIAARPNLNAHLTSILTRRGGPKVIETLAANRSAAFSSQAMRRLRVALKHARAGADAARHRSTNEQAGIAA